MIELLEEYKRQMQSLMNKVNRVTAYHRHGNVVSKKSLDELSNRQLDVEKAIKDATDKLENKDVPIN